MRFWLLAVLACVGMLLIVAGVALVFPPAALIVAGVLCVTVSLVVEVADR